jgi:hypothetical protein
MLGYVTVQSPNQKSNCRLSELAKHAPSSAAANVGAAGKKHPAIARKKKQLLNHLEFRTTKFFIMT